MIYTAKEIQEWDTVANYDKKNWTPCRPIQLSLRIRARAKVAWKVFIGKYDALDWQDVPNYTFRNKS